MRGTILLAFFSLLVMYGLLVLVLAHLNPLMFYRKNKEGMLTGLTLSSSSAAVPTNMKICTEKMGISPTVSAFSIPLGATINMDGFSILLVISGLFLAKAYGVAVPPSSFFSMGIMIILISLGCPGIPGVIFVCLAVVLSAPLQRRRRDIHRRRMAWDLCC